MVSSRTVTAVAGLAVSVLVSVLVWRYLHTFVFFLFVPFVPLLLRRSRRGRADESVRICPSCGFRTADPSHEYCPRDGTRLQ